ncbi:hypothetical protein LBMAG42_39420 [Deltaproteobacteria bacterium]|nr:hypothetical protein LBMAG42_39420 [Deltaproteobacteria bacterium]
MSAPRGGLGDESLDALLRIRQDGLFHPLDVRQDVATLYRAGQFSQVEVWVDPWPVVLPDGEDGVGVRVEYRVFPTPKVVKLTLDGVRAFAPRELFGLVGLAEGDAWAHDDPGRFEAAIAASYRSRGWPSAAVTVARAFDEDGDVELSVSVNEGEPQRVAEVKVRPNEALSEAEVRGVLARAGVAVGKPWTDVSLRAAQDALTRRLHAWAPKVLWWRRSWWPEARVNLKVAPLPEGGDRVSVLIEARRQWTIELADHTERSRLPGEEELVAEMGLDEGARLGRDFAAEASATLNDAAAQDGWLDAKIEVWVAESEEAVKLTLGGSRGPRYVLRTATSTGDTVDPNAIGASTRGGFYGCVDARRGRFGEKPRAAALRARAERFLCQATAESSAEVLSSDLLRRQTVTPESADRAADAIEEFYRSQGYLGVSVSRSAFAPLAASDGPTRQVEVAYEVHAGPRATLRSVEVAGGVPGVPGTALFADLVGKSLNPNSVAERARRIVERHQQQGFLHADAHVTTTLDTAGTDASVRIDVVPGPLVLVRSVLVRGHSRTRRDTIERPIDVHPGDPVSPAGLAEIRRSLYDLGVFSRVSVEAVGDEDRVKDVIVTVTEKKNLSFEVGGGIATDNGAAVFARAGHRNLWGLAHRLTLYGQAGVGWIADGWDLDWVAPEWKAALRYEAPDLPTTGERVSVDVLFNEEQQERSYRIQRSGGGAGVRLKISPEATAELGYRAQYRRLLDVDSGVLVANDAWASELGVAGDGEAQPILPSEGRWASGIDASFVLDLRDDVVNPSRGGIGSLALRVNDDLLSDIAFVRSEGSWTQLVPVAGLGLILRARGGTVIVPNADVNIPIEDRFRAGGGGSFRGFDVDQVGPANNSSAESVDWPDALRPVVDHSQRGAPGRWVTTGGDAMAIGTVEIDVPFPRLGLASLSSWQLAVFTDIGNVWWLSPTVETDSERLGDDPLVRGGLGVGIRRTTPIGPLQLDLGFNPSPLDYRDEATWRVHFAVGAI